MTEGLHELAELLGVAPEYRAWNGERVSVEADTLRDVLTALGADVSTDEAIAQSLRFVREAPWRQTLPPAVVASKGEKRWVPVHVPHGSSFSARVETEMGEWIDVPQVDHWVDPRDVDGHLVGEATIEIPVTVPLGWHTLHVTVDGLDDSGEPTSASAVLVITPPTLPLPSALDHGGAWGLMSQIYALRSATSWGVGDLADTGELAAWAGSELGADFILVNPLHVAEPAAPMTPSPYLPTSRRFTNPIYLRVADVPELADLDEPTRDRVRDLGRRAAAANSRDTIDRDTAWTLKREALGLIFDEELSPRRCAEFDLYRHVEGSGLTDFATWCAIAEVHGAETGTWPAELRDPRSPAVTEFVARHSDAVTFHEWLQWQFDDQLARLQHRTRGAGMRIGVIHDLAVGVHPSGADVWSLRDALAPGVSVGAPPDEFNQLGQDWSQPPWHPQRLAELGYAPYRDMLRSILRHAGGIRVDHILGLVRLWWVPDGHSPRDGAYVYYDADALIGILALEAYRAGGFVIGEDLGTVPEELRETLRQRRVLGTSILWFEFGPDGRPVPPEGYRDLCLATVTTHDLPPTAGYLALKHVDVRAELDLLTRPVAEERAGETARVEAVRSALRDRGLLTEDADTADEIVALHAWLNESPALMIGVAVPDLVGDVRPVNQPGTNDEYPNWRVPVANGSGEPVLLADVVASPIAQRLADILRTGRR